MNDVVIGGDFNLIADPIDRIGPLTSNDIIFRNEMLKLLNKHKLTDVYRKLNILKTEYTYFYKNGQASRLDRFYTTNFNEKQFRESNIIDTKLSDHKMIELEVKIVKRNKWGKGLMEDK